MNSLSFKRLNDPARLLLFCLALTALFGDWNYTQKTPGIDYYVAWTVADQNAVTLLGQSHSSRRGSLPEQRLVGFHEFHRGTSIATRITSPSPFEYPNRHSSLPVRRQMVFTSP